MFESAIEVVIIMLMLIMIAMVIVIVIMSNRMLVWLTATVFVIMFAILILCW